MSQAIDDLRGSLVALVTPMTTSGAIDWAALDGLVDWHLEAGTHGIVPVGTTGESATWNYWTSQVKNDSRRTQTSGRLTLWGGLTLAFVCRWWN